MNQFISPWMKWDRSCNIYHLVHFHPFPNLGIAITKFFIRDLTSQELLLVLLCKTKPLAQSLMNIFPNGAFLGECSIKVKDYPSKSAIYVHHYFPLWRYARVGTNPILFPSSISLSDMRCISLS